MDLCVAGAGVADRCRNMLTSLVFTLPQSRGRCLIANDRRDKCLADQWLGSLLIGVLAVFSGVAGRFNEDVSAVLETLLLNSRCRNGLRGVKCSFR